MTIVNPHHNLCPTSSSLISFHWTSSVWGAAILLLNGSFRPNAILGYNNVTFQCVKRSVIL